MMDTDSEHKLPNAARAPADDAPSLRTRLRNKNPQLTEQFKVQVITTFYAPAVMGTTFASSLLKAAKADEHLLATPEWRAALGEAVERIREGCTALRTLPSPGTVAAYQTALKSTDLLESFLFQCSLCLASPDAEHLGRASESLKQAQDVLARAGRALVVHGQRATPSRKRAVD